MFHACNITINERDRSHPCMNSREINSTILIQHDSCYTRIAQTPTGDFHHCSLSVICEQPGQGHSQVLGTTNECPPTFKSKMDHTEDMAK